MTWATIIAALLSAFGPLLAEWLKKWLEEKLSRASDGIAAPVTHGSPERAAGALFDAALASTPRFAPARRALLRRLRAVAVSRAPELVGVGAVELTHAEVEEIRDAANAAGNE